MKLGSLRNRTVVDYVIEIAPCPPSIRRCIITRIVSPSCDNYTAPVPLQTPESLTANQLCGYTCFATAAFFT